MSRMWTPEEAATEFKVSVQTIQAWCKSKDPDLFPNATKPGGGRLWRIPDEDIEREIARRKGELPAINKSEQSQVVKDAKERTAIAEANKATSAENTAASLERIMQTCAELAKDPKTFEDEVRNLERGIENQAEIVARKVAKETEVHRQELVQAKEDAESERLAYIEKARKYNPVIEGLEEKVKDRATEIRRLTRLLGGEAQVKIKLSKADKEEAEQVRIQEEAEAIQMRKSAQEAFDAENYPHIDAISEGLAVIDQMQKEAKRHGFRGEVFDELLNARWIYIYRASKYDKVEPESEKQVDINKAYDLTEKNKDRVRKNYANIVLAFKDTTHDVYSTIEEIQNNMQVSPLISFFTKDADKLEYYSDMFKYLCGSEGTRGCTGRIEDIMGLYDGCEDGSREPKKEEIKVGEEEKPEVVAR